MPVKVSRLLISALVVSLLALSSSGEHLPVRVYTTADGLSSRAEGAGITNVILTLTNASGEVLTARTSPFGYYRFDGVLAGETYILSITSKRYTFSQSTRVLSVLDNLENVDFIADGVN